MPIYVYRAESKAGCPHCQAGFEVLQRLGEAPLEECPRCLAPIAKLISAPNLSTSGPSLSDENVGKHGFTRYRKLDKGVYEKTAGRGPDLIRDKK